MTRIVNTTLREDICYSHLQTDGEKDELAVAITEYYRDKDFQVIVD
ncbi:MAG: hypothetical protein IKZ69_05140 [Lachnospiraceae bacterium]|nr:hypothetical protein [Lachnospiraceae bacterium]